MLYATYGYIHIIHIHSKAIKTLTEMIHTKFRLIASFGTGEAIESGKNIHTWISIIFYFKKLEAFMSALFSLLSHLFQAPPVCTPALVLHWVDASGFLSPWHGGEEWG